MESQKSKLEFEKKSDWTSLSFLKTSHVLSEKFNQFYD